MRFNALVALVALQGLFISSLKTCSIGTYLASQGSLSCCIQGEGSKSCPFFPSGKDNQSGGSILCCDQERIETKAPPLDFQLQEEAPYSPLITSANLPFTLSPVYETLLNAPTIVLPQIRRSAVFTRAPPAVLS